MSSPKFDDKFIPYSKTNFKLILIMLSDKVIFHNEELCGDSNKFFELSVAQNRLAVTDSILIGGQRRQVQKMMLFKLGWIDTYWGAPMKVNIDTKL